MKKSTQHCILTPILLGLSFLCVLQSAQGAGDLPTKFTNQGGIINTRHNLTQKPIGGSYIIMDNYRNNYAEVCVYCHTPHGANTTVDLPLWNRTVKSVSYTTYDTLNTTSLTSEVFQPGITSRACLTCHDGTLAMDSILNMPGSGGYEAGQETIQNTSFLNLWTNEGDRKAVHMTFDATDLNPQTSYSCLVCHSKDAGILGGSATAFDLAAIGTNLTDEHPIGMDMPSVDFNSPSGVRSNIEWFDTDGDSRPDTDEIRLYNTGSGARVECASCHDPHGVSPSGYGGTINPTFLRISNNGSAVCLTCHIK